MALLEAVSVSTVLFHRWISNTSGFGPLMTTCVLNDKLRALDLEVLLSVAVVVVMLDTLDVVSVKLVLVVVVGVSTWYIKEIHPLMP